MSDVILPQRQCASKELCVHPEQTNDGYLPETEVYFYFNNGKADNRCKKCRCTGSRKNYKKDRTRLLSIKKEKYREDPETHKRKSREYRENNKDVVLERHQRYDSEHRQERRDYQKKRRANPLKERSRTSSENKIHNARRRALKKNLPHTLTTNEWEYALLYFNNSCAVCGASFNGLFVEIELHADHWIPISKGGGTTADNMVPLCGGVDGCNLSKSGKLPRKWLEEEFGKKKAKDVLKRVNDYFRLIRSK